MDLCFKTTDSLFAFISRPSAFICFAKNATIADRLLSLLQNLQNTSNSLDNIN